MPVDYFFKIDGILGESKDAKHAGDVDVGAWSWGETAPASGGLGGGGGAGKVAIQDLNFTSRFSKASPQLMLACASGRHIKSAVLTGRPVFSVQHHPEASPGPQDSHYLFRRFVNLIRERRGEPALAER